VNYLLWTGISSLAPEILIPHGSIVKRCRQFQQDQTHIVEENPQGKNTQDQLRGLEHDPERFFLYGWLNKLSQTRRTNHASFVFRHTFPAEVPVTGKAFGDCFPLPVQQTSLLRYIAAYVTQSLFSPLPEYDQRPVIGHL
jgi:hypothetical protein